MAKNIVEVIIDGKLYYLGGDESEAYIQSVASYLNHKVKDLKKSQTYLKLPPDMQSFHLALSVADDYMSLKEDVSQIQHSQEEQKSDLYEIKNELVRMQIKKESLEKQLEDYKRRIQELEKDWK